MNKNKRLLSIALVFMMLFACPVTVRADKLQDKLDEAQEKQEEIEQKQEEAKKQKKVLREELEKISSKMKKAQKELSAKEKEIDEAETKLSEAKAVEYEQYASMKKRIKYMYENGNSSFFEILMESKSMGDFLNKAEYIKTISEQDRDQLLEYQKTVKGIEETEAKLEKEYEKLRGLQNVLKEEKNKVNQMVSNTDAELKELSSDLDDVVSDIEDIERRIKEAEELQNQGTGGNGQTVITGNGILSNPAPAARISSHFGPRVAPTAGASTFHNGMDFAAPTGTPIYAAASGKVITAQYNNIRGYYLVIAHDNGLQTWYQHCSAMYVSVGQTVKKGQNIAAIGNTGISTGAHLHFEVHVGGTPVDPRNYL